MRRGTNTEGLDDGAPEEDWSQENLDELVLMDIPLENGTVGKIVYRNGGVVDALALEDLCDKASLNNSCWSWNSMCMVRSTTVEVVQL